MGKVTFSNSYATDGDSINWSAISGIRDVKQVRVQPTDGTYFFKADLANNKLLAYTATATQAANTTDLSAVTCDIEVIGNI